MAGTRPIVGKDPLRPDCYEAAQDPTIIGGRSPPQGYGRDSTHRQKRPTVLIATRPPKDPTIVGGCPDCYEAAQDPTIVGGRPPQG